MKIVLHSFQYNYLIYNSQPICNVENVTQFVRLYCVDSIFFIEIFGFNAIFYFLCAVK